jgi:hypothetical protein
MTYLSPEDFTGEFQIAKRVSTYAKLTSMCNTDRLPGHDNVFLPMAI